MGTHFFVRVDRVRLPSSQHSSTQLGNRRVLEPELVLRKQHSITDYRDFN